MEVHYLPVSVNKRGMATSGCADWTSGGDQKVAIRLKFLPFFAMLHHDVFSATSNLAQEERRRKGVSNADKCLQLLFQFKSCLELD